jgi:uncharacterized protein YkwD
MSLTRRRFVTLILTGGPLALTGQAAAPLAADTPGEVEWHLNFLTNQQRSWRRLTPLTWSDGLAAAARRHSRDMMVRGFFAHRTPEGLGPGDRVVREGLHFEFCAENLYLMRGGQSDPAELASSIIAGWMASPPHSRNVVDPAARYLGVGVAIADRLVIATQLFTA